MTDQSTEVPASTPVRSREINETDEPETEFSFRLKPKLKTEKSNEKKIPRHFLGIWEPFIFENNIFLNLNKDAIFN